MADSILEFFVSIFTNLIANDFPLPDSDDTNMSQAFQSELSSEPFDSALSNASVASFWTQVQASSVRQSLIDLHCHLTNIDSTGSPGPGHFDHDHELERIVTLLRDRLEREGVEWEGQLRELVERIVGLVGNSGISASNGSSGGTLEVPASTLLIQSRLGRDGRRNGLKSKIKDKARRKLDSISRAVMGLEMEVCTQSVDYTSDSEEYDLPTTAGGFPSTTRSPASPNAADGFRNNTNSDNVWQASRSADISENLSFRNRSINRSPASAARSVILLNSMSKTSPLPQHRHRKDPQRQEYTELAQPDPSVSLHIPADPWDSIPVARDPQEAPDLPDFERDQEVPSTAVYQIPDDPWDCIPYEPANLSRHNSLAKHDPPRTETNRGTKYHPLFSLRPLTIYYELESSENPSPVPAHKTPQAGSPIRSSMFEPFDPPSLPDLCSEPPTPAAKSPLTPDSSFDIVTSFDLLHLNTAGSTGKHPDHRPLAVGQLKRWSLLLDANADPYKNPWAELALDVL